MTAQDQTQTIEPDTNYNVPDNIRKPYPVFSTTTENSPFIKFTKPFSKMRRQTSAKIIWFTVVDVQSLHRDFIEYETIYYEGYLKPRYSNIPKDGKVIVLYLIGDLGIPFSSVRPYTPEKENIYRALLGKPMRIVVRDKYDEGFNGKQKV